MNLNCNLLQKKKKTVGKWDGYCQIKTERIELTANACK